MDERERQALITEMNNKWIDISVEYRDKGLTARDVLETLEQAVIGMKIVVEIVDQANTPVG